MKRCIALDLDSCIGCYACETACKTTNHVDLGIKWNRVIQVGPHGDFPNLEMYWLPIQCQQCLNPACVDVCPTGASYVAEDGVVRIEAESCIGCESCIQACPYSVRTLNAKTGVVEKCQMCPDLDEPACVTNCAVGALHVFDMDAEDPAALFPEFGAEDFHKMTDLGTNPAHVFMLRPRIANWIETADLASTNPEWENSTWMKQA